MLVGSPTLISSDYQWNYEISVDSLEALNSGLPDGGTFFTIDNFVGYAGSIAAPTDWTAAFSAGNLVFTYTGPTTTPTGDVTGFSALSTDSAVNASGVFGYQAENLSTGGLDFGGGPVDVPMAATPEPVSVGLVGGALLGLAVLSRRKFARQ
ncbi:MAG: PEP-CTERM sorting domain-containing protein [Bryobacteraceae bacterium]